MRNNRIFAKQPFETKSPRRWTEGLPEGSISVLAYCTQARSFKMHESSHDEKVGIPQHENRGGRFVFWKGGFQAVGFLAYKMVTVFCCCRKISKDSGF